MKYKVSVIVPVYNVEKYLTQCIQSLLDQTLKSIEIILVDDKSPDNCPLLCEDFACQNPNVRVIHKENNEGLGMACNTGLSLAQGEYVAFCDSDDYVDKNMYQAMYELATQYHCDAVFSGLNIVNSDGVFINKMEHFDQLTIYDNNAEIDSFIKNMIASLTQEKKERNIQVSAKVVLYKREIIEKEQIRFVSERIIPSEDLLFNIDFLRYCHFICITPKAFYNYRTNPASISHSFKKDKFILYKNLYYTLINKFTQNQDYTLRIQKLFLGYTRNLISRIIKADIEQKKKKRIISSVCTDPIWESIWKTYPIRSMPWKHRLFALAQKHNNFRILTLLIKLRK